MCMCERKESREEKHKIDKGKRKYSRRCLLTRRIRNTKNVTLEGATTKTL